MMKDVVIYTDGACKNNPGEGGWAAIITNGAFRKEIVGYEAQTTNNRMELHGAISALESLDELSNVTLYTDSAYLCCAINENWLGKWKTNQWRTSDRKAVKNKDLWLRLDAMITKHKVAFVKIKGHSGNMLNERCDFLANEAILRKALQTTEKE